MYKLFQRLSRRQKITRNEWIQFPRRWDAEWSGKLLLPQLSLLPAVFSRPCRGRPFQRSKLPTLQCQWLGWKEPSFRCQIQNFSVRKIRSKEVIDTEMESKGPKEIFDWMSMVSNWPFLGLQVGRFHQGDTFSCLILNVYFDRVSSSFLDRGSLVIHFCNALTDKVSQLILERWCHQFQSCRFVRPLGS